MPALRSWGNDLANFAFSAVEVHEVSPSSIRIPATCILLAQAVAFAGSAMVAAKSSTADSRDNMLFVSNT